MKNFLLLVAFLIVAFIGANAQNEHYYYYQGDKVYINLDRKRVTLIVENDFKKSSVNALNFKPFVLTTEIENQDVKFSNVEFEDEITLSEYESKLNVLNNNSKVIKANPNFTNSEGKTLGLSNYFYVKLKSTSDYSLLELKAIEKNVIIVEQNKFMPLWYTLKVTKNTNGSSLDIANQFFETGLFSSCQPDFLSDDRMCSEDPEFGNLWGLSNSNNPGIDINVCPAWNITEGQGVKVAVLDTGIFKTHIDLNSNIHSVSYNSETNTSPSQLFGSHGTHVAGTIAAIKDNEIQVVGVAPSAKLVDVSNSLDATPNSRMKRADGINWAYQNGADIINNSWGSSVQYEVIDDAINNALQNGRNGLGCVIVFASGNSYGSVSYPANSNPDILTVGAITPNGGKASFSNYGAQLDLVAPGVDIFSTIPNNEIDYKNGTSMAAPHVSGVAALILSVNPCLTGKQVGDIIEKTAQKVGNYSYTNNTDRPNGTWNNEMGYGLVNAYEAVKMAQQTGIDLYISDCVNDFGDEPSLVCQDVVWHSPDIWVRNNQDNIAQNQNPIYKSNGEPNYIYVRVKNRGCTQSGVNDKLQVHWTKANTSFAWPNYWNGTELNINGVPLGGSLSAIDIPSIAADGDVVLEIPWVVPNPQDYSNFGDEMWHYCLMARIISDDDQMTYPETQDHFSNVKNNNNIAHKNVTIIVPAQGKINGVIAMGNPFAQDEIFGIKFVSDRLKGNEIFREAEISFVIDETLQLVLNQSKVRLHNIKQIEK